MVKKNKPKFSMWMAITAFLLGFTLSAFAFGILAKITMALFTLLALSGVVAIFLLKPSNEANKVPFIKIFLPLAFVQAALFFITFIFFYTFEIQTTENARLHTLELGSVLQVMKSHIFTLGICPWLLYGILGVGFAYFAVHVKRTPSFARIIVPNIERHPQLVMYNYFWVVTESVIALPFIWLLSLSIVWLSEGAGASLSIPSIYHYPFRTLFLSAIMIFVLARANRRFLNWCHEKKLPLGGMFVLYTCIISLFIVALQAMAEIFSVGVEKTEAGQVLKSAFAGSFTAEALDKRFTLFILGWWAVWIPWMSSVIARIAINYLARPWSMLLISMLFPALVFWGLSEVWESQNFSAIYQILNLTASKITIAIFFLLFMMLAYGKVYNTADISRGAMLSLGQGRAAPLTNWATIVVTCLFCYMLGHFMMGWLPAQVICTVASLFMITMVTAFIVRLVLDRDPLMVEVKNMAQ